MSSRFHLIACVTSNLSTPNAQVLFAVASTQKSIIQVSPNAWVLCSQFSSLAPHSCFPSSHHRRYFVCIQSASEERCLHHLSLFAPLTHFCPATCHQSGVNTPTHICMHAHTHTGVPSIAAKGRPNASFDVMALWSLS